MTANHTHEGQVHLESPLEGFSKCHASILSQLQAFADLPALVAAADRAQTIAADTLVLFQDSVYGHHEDEETDLFPAVLRSAHQGEEFDRAQLMVERLAAEHRAMETLWKKLQPAVKAAARGKRCDLDVAAVEELVRAYVAHARFEEQQFLPLAREILVRNGNHMLALGVALHLRHAPSISGYI